MTTELSHPAAVISPSSTLSHQIDNDPGTVFIHHVCRDCYFGYIFQRHWQTISGVALVLTGQR